MRIAILAQEEPVFIGPMIIKLMKRLKGEICLVAISNAREGGQKVKGLRNNLKRRKTKMALAI